MEIRVRRNGSIIVLDITGRIDVNSAAIIETVGSIIREGYCDILCNFEEVESIDYMGVSVLVIAYKEVINNNGRMKFTSIPAQLKGIFSIAGLDRVIELYGTEELAIESFKEDKAIENIKKLQLRRRFKRLPIDIKIELKGKYENPPVCVKVDILNLSGVGAYIYGCDKFKLGDVVILKLKLPPKSSELEIEATVVWLSDKQVQHHLHPGMGVQFYNISASVQEKLVDFIDRNLSLMSTDDFE